ncbi:MAG: DUF4373 domain-containing protein [Sphingobacteriales bacterium]|nr:MAG: DUF4373 domain-containing protein [Sphingobacteriales bacterium]
MQIMSPPLSVSSLHTNPTTMPRAKILRHSTDARQNEKIAALVGDYGPAGYGAYWMILEIMHREEGMRIEHDKARMRRLAGQVGMAADAFAQLLENMIEIYELLAIEDNHLVSTLSYTRRSKQQKPEAIEVSTTGEVPMEYLSDEEETKVCLNAGYSTKEIEMHRRLRQVVLQKAPDVSKHLSPLNINQSMALYADYKEKSIFHAIGQLQANPDLCIKAKTTFDAIRDVMSMQLLRKGHCV